MQKKTETPSEPASSAPSGASDDEIIDRIERAFEETAFDAMTREVQEGLRERLKGYIGQVDPAATERAVTTLLHSLGATTVEVQHDAQDPTLIHVKIEAPLTQYITGKMKL